MDYWFKKGNQGAISKITLPTPSLLKNIIGLNLDYLKSLLEILVFEILIYKMKAFHSG
jgi:hypothetical protein